MYNGRALPLFQSLSFCETFPLPLPLWFLKARAVFIIVQTEEVFRGILLKLYDRHRETVSFFVDAVDRRGPLIYKSHESTDES